MTHAPLAAALPFWLSLGLLPLAALAATLGGWWFLLMPLYAWFLTSVLDLVLGLDERNPDPQTPQARLRWHRAITLIWAPLQAAMIFGGIWYAAHGTLSGWEKLGLFFGIGVASGSVGIVYAHELVHQRNRLERWLGDLLLASVLYSHFRSEHLLVHHAWVGTPRDAVTARYNEGFYRFFLRVLRDSPRSAWQAEAGRLRRSGRSALDRRNPFWRYGALQLAMLGLAAALGGWQGVALFVWQALVAVWQLELTNYVEHYGLTREYLGNGRYERIRPHHSWNAAHRATNWLLINLQRHSDHHYQPDRRFPLLQTYGPDVAPQLPLGYPAMNFLAMVPPLWRRRMNPRVRAWRRQFYPGITDWRPYNRGELPMPGERS
ncbi:MULTISPECIES: alkane 1-monooxygenase [unclassified Paracoccus (in: a-proteobacteria)]|uniref:alkane 1-monooxygenase n=1 Tax=unclassified Paracoccus (in: a-proteobacteria) TaxID=2688777 RepID=UPI0012B2DFFE|nr:MULTISPECIES: alkane 1-monooxygenase [unclassified Paracoccus (in: a-proteobacteria)]UXU75094.1 alkane 1-monooxygenase [Paracoccus sp. SMMA_5]UXU80997.1 alkane 1-monooxygenase [Paracoccus sp. SMMA_5_TC]